MKPHSYKGLCQIPVDHSQTCHVIAPFAKPNKLSEHVYFFLSPLVHTLASALRTNHSLSWVASTSTSNVRLNNCLPPITTGNTDTSVDYN
jgi:hypothetical protein